MIYHLVQVMDAKILPYVIFLVVPVLGRMSDGNELVRMVMTNCFAQLIKLVPLEVCFFLILTVPFQLLSRSYLPCILMPGVCERSLGWYP